MKKTLNKILFFLLCVFHWSVFAHPQKTLTVILDWFMNPNHAPLFVAIEEGFFAKEGLQVKLVTPANATDGEKMVAVGQADIAITYQPALMYHVTNGLPVIRFATLIDKPLNCFIVLDTGEINSLKDLKGKKIGYSTSGTDSVVFSTMLESVNLKLKDIYTINVGFNLISALLTNRIDGFTGGMRNFEPLAIKLAGKSPRVFYPEEYGFPKYEELIFVARKNKVSDPSLIKFVRALREGVSYLRKNPSASWEKFATSHPEMNNDLNKKAWFITLPYFANNPAKLNKRYYEELAQFMWKRGLIKYLPKIGEYTVELE